MNPVPDPTMLPARDDTATTEYHRGLPLPVHPPLLAPEPPRNQRPGPASPQIAARPRTTPQPTLPPPGPTLASRGPTQPRSAPQSTQPPRSALPPAPMQLAPRPGTAPAWASPAPCTTCPFRQPPDRTLILPDQQATSPPTATQLIPAGGTGSTTILQAVAPPPVRRRPTPPPPRRSYLLHLQVGLWIVITIGLLILALRPTS
jgi:hypothetical protein